MKLYNSPIIRSYNSSALLYAINIATTQYDQGQVNVRIRATAYNSPFAIEQQIDLEHDISNLTKKV